MSEVIFEMVTREQEDIFIKISDDVHKNELFVKAEKNFLNGLDKIEDKDLKLGIEADSNTMETAVIEVAYSKGFADAIKLISKSVQY